MNEKKKPKENTTNSETRHFLQNFMMSSVFLHVRQPTCHLQ